MLMVMYSNDYVAPPDDNDNNDIDNDNINDSNK